MLGISETEDEMMDLKFIVNSKVIVLKILLSDRELCQKLTTDDLYTFQYLHMLCEQKFIAVGGPVSDVKRVVQNEEIPVSTEIKDDDKSLSLDAINISEGRSQKDSTIESTISTKPVGNQKFKLWNDKETKFLLDKYEAYVSQVGPMKKFKTKKVMWKKISSDLQDELQSKRDFVQVENRYKTCLKRKKTAVEHNAKSGNAREVVQFEEELSKIAANDDSIEPEILCSAKKTRYLKVPPEKAQSAKRRTSQDLLEELHKKKEDAKERRHQEKMALITTLLNKNQEL